MFPEKIALSDDDFTRVSRTVYDHCGINLKADKRELVQSRLAKLIRGSTFKCYSDYLDHVLSDSAQPDFVHFIDNLSTNLTSFFRESKHFDYLQQVLIPSLVSNAPSPERLRLRCWSAGCSSGEEPYSLAVTLAESIPSACRANVKILASDISSRMVRAAKEGCYPEKRLEGVASAIRTKYFESKAGTGERNFLARSELRKMLVFRQINLMQEWPVSSGIDFIFCRNVMIYFDKPTQERLVNRYYDVLSPGGMLFIGHSESLSGTKHRFNYIEPTIYQKK